MPKSSIVNEFRIKGRAGSQLKFSRRRRQVGAVKAGRWLRGCGEGGSQKSG